MIQISLAAARVNANLTQEDVARHLRKSKQTICSWENGKTEIDSANLAALSLLYNIPTANIYLCKNQT